MRAGLKDPQKQAVWCGGKSAEGGIRVLGFSPASVSLCCVILCKSLALSVLFPSCTSKGSDWVAFSALTFFHSLREAGEGGLKRGDQEATSLSDILRQARMPGRGDPEELIFTACTCGWAALPFALALDSLEPAADPGPCRARSHLLPSPRLLGQPGKFSGLAYLIHLESQTISRLIWRAQKQPKQGPQLTNERGQTRGRAGTYRKPHSRSG